MEAAKQQVRLILLVAEVLTSLIDHLFVKCRETSSPNSKPTSSKLEGRRRLTPRLWSNFERNSTRLLLRIRS